jgi:myo-inositol 2-dehydrogenase / D-chiro-inositol 1-dehydrogenase
LTEPSSRRTFLKTSAAAGASLVALAPAVHAAGNDTLRIGLIGCGNRGTGAATQALKADPNLKLVAMGDVFADRLAGSLAQLKGDPEVAAKVDVSKDRQFVGFDAYKQVLGAGVDVVLLTAPPGFRPDHIEASVAAGKHIFAEKPVAVDAPGVRRVIAACAEARKKNLAVVSGLCWRYDAGKRETMKRIHEGAIGDLVALQCTYNTGYLRMFPREKKWSDMEWQLRNWLYFTWLSGDHIVEQHIHSLDKMAWAMKDEYPIRASGMGGRQQRTDPAYGHIFDHHAVVYEFKNGVKLFSQCRQQKDCANDVSDHLMGTRGTCDVMKHTIIGEKPWRYRPADGPGGNMYQIEHNELFASIRAGKPINNADYMTKSTLMAIMGRMATYTGKIITWDMASGSRQDLMPAKLEWGSLPMPPVARPGITKFV